MAPHWRHWLVAGLVKAMPLFVRNQIFGGEMWKRYEEQQQEIKDAKKAE